uniref:Uncharacterized protein n=1 Tax=Oryza glumipatula TaxID=40148 RepID=A0A0E0BUP7_9ORYZ
MAGGERAKATVGGGWTYGGGGGWLSGGGGGEGEGETRGMSSLFTACVVVISLGMERGRWGAASDSCRTFHRNGPKRHIIMILPENVATLSSQHETKEKVLSYSDASDVLRYAFTMTGATIDHEYKELSLAVEHDMLLREECSIVFTLIKWRPTLPPPKPLVAGPSPSPHGALALSSARELFLQLRDTLSEDTTTPVPLKQTPLLDVTGAARKARVRL